MCLIFPKKKKKKKASNFQNVTKTATTILLHSRQVTACVCLECTRLQRQTFRGQCGAMRCDAVVSHGDRGIVAALPSSKSKRRGTRGARSLPSFTLAPAKSFTSFSDSPERIGIGFFFVFFLINLTGRPRRLKRRRRGDGEGRDEAGLLIKATGQQASFIAPPARLLFLLCASFQYLFFFSFLFLLNKSIEQLSARHSQSFVYLSVKRRSCRQIPYTCA